MAKDTGQNATEGSAFRAGPPQVRTPLRDNLESIVIAIVLVLVIRQVLVEAFRIQHGSMAPTLLGDYREVRCPNCAWTFDVGLDKSSAEGTVKCPNCAYEWPGLNEYDDHHRPLELKWPSWLWNSATVQGDGKITGPSIANIVPRGAARIFVNKIIYRLRQPRRWEVCVFIFPLYDATCRICGWEGHVYQDKVKGFKCPQCGSEDVDIEARNYIKRVVGLPGETVNIRDGDVYINGVIARKPPDVQAEIWMPVFDSFFMPTKEVEPLWDLSKAPERWTRDPKGGVLEVKAQGAADPVMAAYAPDITDYYPYDGPDFDPPKEVGDVRIRAQVRALAQDELGGEAVLAIQANGRVFTFHMGTGEQPGAVLEDNGAPVREGHLSGAGLKQGEWISLENYDDRVVAMVDGRELFTYDYEGRPGKGRAVRFGARGADLLWQRIIIDRDVYYTSVPGPAAQGAKLGPDEYFMLGDNSPASSDSRRWERPGIPGANIIGKASFVFWPIQCWKLMATPAARR